MLRIKIIFCVLIVFCFSCMKQNDYETRPSGLLFSLESIAENQKKIKPLDYVQFKIYQINDSNKVIQEKRLFIRIPKKPTPGGILEALSLINEQEIGKFKTNARLIESEFKKLTKWKCFSSDSIVTFYIYIDKIFTPDEYEIKGKEFMVWMQQNTVKPNDYSLQIYQIEEHIRAHKWAMENTPNGLFYKWIKKNPMGKKISFGSAVSIQYKGSFLSGEVFNNTFGTKQYLDFYIGQEMQVLKGIEEALLLMRDGEKMALLLPSWLAFGEEGNSTGIIPPNTPVYYELTVKIQ
jgi:FKBP-type peptidyl-prolyl cis-trans isomerase